MCSELVGAWRSASIAPPTRRARPRRPGTRASTVGVPAVHAHQQVAVALQVGGEPTDELLQPELLVDVVADGREHRPDADRRRGRGRPARRRGGPRRRCGPASSSVKNVCSTTPSTTRAGELERLLADRGEHHRDVLVERRVLARGTGSWPAGPSWPMIISPCHSRRSMPIASSSCAIVTRGSAHDVEQQVEAAPEAEREAAAGEPVHRRRRTSR